MTENWESFSEISIEVPSEENESFEQDSDTQALLPGAPSKSPKQMPSFFSVEFYRRCWDVTTNEVRLRVKSAIYPKQDFISGLHGKPDLYGPFWVAVTLCFSTAICGNLSHFIQNSGNPNFKYTPEFERVTSAASAIFGYVFVFPFFLSVLMYYSKIMIGFSTVELLTAYGYSLSVFIPISFLWMIPANWLRWLLVVVGSLVSGSVVASPIWRGLKKVVANKKQAYIILVLAVAANVALAVGFKMYFFEAPLVSQDMSVPAAVAEIPEQIIENPVAEKTEVELKPAEPEIPAQEPVENQIAPEAESQEQIKEEPIEAKEEDVEIAEKAVVENLPAGEPQDPNAPGEIPAVEAEEIENKEEQEVKEILAELPRADPNDHVIPEPQDPNENHSEENAPAEEKLPEEPQEAPKEIVLPRVQS